MESADDRHRSPWSRREKVLRVLWAVVQATVFRHSPHPLYRWRAWLLRRFGAKLGVNVRVRPSVRITIPWNLTLGDQTSVGDDAILYALGPITTGRFVTVSQYAHLCAGSHDARDRRMTLLRPPITLGDDVWVAADAFVGPNVTVGDVKPEHDRDSGEREFQHRQQPQQGDCPKHERESHPGLLRQLAPR